MGLLRESSCGAQYAIVIRSQMGDTEADWRIATPFLFGGDRHPYVESLAHRPGDIRSEHRRACNHQVPHTIPNGSGRLLIAVERMTMFLRKEVDLTTITPKNVDSLEVSPSLGVLWACEVDSLDQRHRQHYQVSGKGKARSND